MKIIKVETFVVNQDLKNGEKFAFSQAWYNSRTIMILKITTDEGIVGWGEALGLAFIDKTIIDDYMAGMIIGKDPMDTEVIWEQLYNQFRDNCRKGSIIGAISAIDIALWDIKGKAFNLPIYKLMGGTPRERIKPYATGLYRKELPTAVNDLIKEAESYVEQGFNAIKIKIGFGVDDDIKTVREIRRALGGSIQLMVDVNHAYNASTAIKLSKNIEEYDITWLEEPVPPEDIEGYIEVKSKTNIPVSGGEGEFCRYGFNDLLRKRAVDIVQPDCCRAGGISEFKKIAVLASIYNIQCYPHVWGGAIALAAGINCAFFLQDFPYKLLQEDMLLECDRTTNIFREKLSINSVEIKGGYILPSDKPGLGIEIDEDLIKRYRVR